MRGPNANGSASQWNIGLLDFFFVSISYLTLTHVVHGYHMV